MFGIIYLDCLINIIEHAVIAVIPKIENRVGTPIGRPHGGVREELLWLTGFHQTGE
jgi:hypothetical protein